MAQEILNITLVQPDIIWENPKENLKKYTDLLHRIEKTDVIILPEMFTTGFSMNPKKLAGSFNGETVTWMKNTAKLKDAAVVGSIIFEENKKYYNRALWANSDGNILVYDKRHLYTMGQETGFYSPGKSKTIINFKGWKFCPQICYDLRFPVFARNLEDYDVVFYMANWPSPRHHVWKNLLQARAIENQSYCFGVNRVGTDGAGLQYLGDSACVDPKGYVDFMGENANIQSFEISYSKLHQFRAKFPLLTDRDNFQIL